MPNLATSLRALQSTGLRAGKSARGWLTRVYAHPYNRERPLTALARLGRWHVLRATGRSRDLEFWGTRTIRCYPDADGSMWLILNVVMDWNEFHFMRRYLRPSDTFFDVGANLGIYTLWVSQFIDTKAGLGRIVAFEPDPVNLLRLRDQLALNALTQVEVADVALSNSIGSVRFSQGTDMVNHLVTEADGGAFIEVPTTTLDEYCRSHHVSRINFAKIDVEGAEQLVLSGARDTLARKLIDVIQLEFNHQVVDRGLEAGAVEGQLSAAGYALYRFVKATGVLELVRQVDLDKHENLFAIHDIAAVRARLAETSSSQA